MLFLQANVGILLQLSKKERGFVFLPFKKCFPHMFLRWRVKYCKVFPSQHNVAVPQNTRADAQL